MIVLSKWKRTALCVLCIFIAGGLAFSIPTYFLMRYTPSSDGDSVSISKQTVMLAPYSLDDYVADNPELNDIEGKRLAVVEMELVLPEITTTYEVEQIKNDIYRWEWTEYGGGYGVYADKHVRMNFNRFVIPVDVEWKAVDDRIIAGVSTTCKEVELSNAAFYMNKSELFNEPRFRLGFAIGGRAVDDRLGGIVQAEIGYKSFGISYQFDGNHGILAGYEYRFW